MSANPDAAVSSEPRSRSVTSIINALCEEQGITPEEFARRDVTPDPYWVGLQPWLAEQGYQLRPRFRPGWTPSWIQVQVQAEGFGKGRYKWECEDYQVYYKGDVMDALRVRDGALVMFKRVASDKNHEWSEEARLAEFLADPSVASDSRNHCVPIYDILEVPQKEDEVLIVMPVLSHVDHPRFETVGEVVVFLQQMIEGLLFLHSHNIVHRDLKYDNILADGGALYDEHPHPVKPHRDSQKSYHGYKPIQPRFSRTTKPINYFYIDFGFSKKYASRTGNIEFSPWGPLKYHGMVPEFNAPDYTPADPFPVDVCMLGIVIREHFVAGSDPKDRYSGKANMEWMDALTREMIIDDPVARPTIEEVMERYTALTKDLGTWKLRSPVYDLEEWTWPWTRVRHWIVQIYRMVRGVPAVPTPRHRGILRDQTPACYP